MRRLILDTLFMRIFLVLFGLIMAGLILGMAVSFYFYPPPPPPSLKVFPLPHLHRSHLLPPLPHVLIELGATCVGILISTWITARWLTRPVIRFARAAEELGQNLDRQPIDETGVHEYRQVAHSLNQMQLQLKDQMAKRARFLAAVSHDLRTPVTRLRMRIESVVPAELQRKLLDDITEITLLTDATLEYLRGNSNPEPYEMLDIIALLDAMSDNAQEQGEHVTVSGSAKPIVARPMALQRCLDNLIRNAIRYGHRADITVIDAESHVRIDLRDSGCGIPEAELEKVFEPFYRVEQSRNKATGGVGLGLSIARDIVQQHGGTLKLRNREGGGLVAELVLPRKQE